MRKFLMLLFSMVLTTQVQAQTPYTFQVEDFVPGDSAGQVYAVARIVEKGSGAFPVEPDANGLIVFDPVTMNAIRPYFLIPSNTASFIEPVDSSTHQYYLLSMSRADQLPKVTLDLNDVPISNLLQSLKGGIGVLQRTAGIDPAPDYEAGMARVNLLSFVKGRISMRGASLSVEDIITRVNAETDYAIGLEDGEPVVLSCPEQDMFCRELSDPEARGLVRLQFANFDPQTAATTDFIVVGYDTGKGASSAKVQPDSEGWIEHEYNRTRGKNGRLDSHFYLMSLAQGQDEPLVTLDIVDAPVDQLLRSLQLGLNQFAMRRGISAREIPERNRTVVYNPAMKKMRVAFSAVDLGFNEVLDSIFEQTSCRIDLVQDTLRVVACP